MSTYSVSFSIMNLWLWGSHFLVILLFLRWFGSKWERLTWLTCTRKRWLKIWIYFGLVHVIGMTIICVINNPDICDICFYRIGWPADVVEFILPVRYHEYIEIPIIAILSRAIAEAIIRCGFAAFAWWLYNWWTEKIRGPRTISNRERLGMSLLTGAWLLGIANWIAFYWQYPRMEEHVTCGVPFAFFQVNGGFVYFEYFVWRSVIWNALAMVGFSLVLAAIWIWIARRNSDALSDQCC
jgi:hypothetical protein